MTQFPNIPLILNQSQRFIGLDTYNSPQDQKEGFLSLCDNMYVKGYTLRPRPGLVGQFTTPLGFPLYALTPYLTTDAGGNQITVMAFSANGKLYQTTKGSSTYTEVQWTDPAAALHSFTLNSAQTYIERIGHYAYIIGSTDGKLYRTDLTNAASSPVTGLTGPGALNSTLTNIVLDAAAVASWTSTTPVIGANLVLDPSFEAQTANVANTFAAPWFVGHGPDPDVRTSTNGMVPLDGTKALMLDNPGESVYQTIAVPLHYQGVGGSFSFGAYAFSSVDGCNVQVQMDALDGSGNVLASQTQNFPVLKTLGGSNPWTPLQKTFSFSGVKGIISVKLWLIGGTGNTPGASPFLDLISLAAKYDAATLTQGSATQINVGATGYSWGNTALVRDFGAGNTPLNGVNRIAVATQFGATVNPVTDVPIRLGLSLDGTTISYTNSVTYAPDNSYFSVDITTIPLAVRSTARYLYIFFDADLPAAAPFSSVFRFGPVAIAGNLSVNYAPYEYQFTEMQDLNSAQPLTQIIESIPSPLGNSISPTGLTAVGVSVLPAATNAATTHFGIYRTGGALQFQYPVLVAYVPVGTDLANSASVSPFYSWNHTTRTFTDDTPDNLYAVAGVTLLDFGRGSAPTNCTAIAQWQGRLWLSKGNDIYASWLVDDTAQGGLYFNSVNIPDDPRNAVKGIRFTAGGLDGDSITALIPFGSNLVVLKQKSIWLVTGFDPTNFSIQSYLLNSGVGAVAKRGNGIVQSHVWFLGPNGLMQFNGDIVDPVSLPLEKFLDPDSGPVAAADYAASILCYHNRRMLLFAPTATGSGNNCAFVYDTRTNGYTRYLFPTGNDAAPLRITAAASLGSGTDTNDLFLGGSDGQIYWHQGYADVAKPGAAAVAIPWKVLSRAYGREFPGDGYWRQNVAQRTFVAYEATSSTLINTVVTGDNPAFAYTRSFSAAVPNGQSRGPVSSNVRGRLLTVSVAGATVDPFVLHAFGLQSTEGRINS